MRIANAARVARAAAVAAWLVAAGFIGCAGGAGDDGAGSAAEKNSPVHASSAAADRPAAAAAVPDTATTSSGVPVVLIAGTSLTAGLGLDPGDAYPAVVQLMADSAGVPVRVVNAGLSGETSAGLLRRIGWLLRDPADVVVIETGANDGLRGVNPDSTRENLRRIVAAVREAQPGAAVMLVQMEAPPNLGESYTGRFRAMYPEVARESGAVLVPFLLDGVAGVASLNQADGIHPNEEGARRAAATVWEALRPVLDSLDRPVPNG
ncbi:MAG TPA: arylesterase [Gemmatimonadales bacterium]